MTLQAFKSELMKDPEFKKQWERFDLWLEIEMKWLEFRSWINNILEHSEKKAGK